MVLLKCGKSEQSSSADVYFVCVCLFIYISKKKRALALIVDTYAMADVNSSAHMITT